jgi:hypothetical protein
MLTMTHHMESRTQHHQRPDHSKAGDCGARTAFATPDVRPDLRRRCGAGYRSLDSRVDRPKIARRWSGALRI